MSAPGLQKAAIFAEDDGLQHPLVSSLAALGARGTCPRHIQNQWLTRFSKDLNPNKIIQEIPGGTNPSSMVAPHELLAELQRAYPLQFKIRPPTL